MYAQTIIIRPPMAHARMPSGRLPPVAVKIFSALKNTPLPMMMPGRRRQAVFFLQFVVHDVSLRSLSAGRAYALPPGESKGSVRRT